MILDSFKLNGKVAIVTGSGQGLGRETALALTEVGANVTIADIKMEEMEQTQKQVEQLGGKSLVVPVDVTKGEQVMDLVERTMQEFGQIDILVNNVGIAIAKSILDLEEIEWRRVQDTNLLGAFLCSKFAGKHMIKQGKGKVINISSTAGFVAATNQSSYAASKAGLILFTKSLALEWAKYNINVNAIAPGYMRTAFSAAVLEDEKASSILLKRIPLRRFGEPKEIVPLVVYLASSASDYMTGETILIDGGHLCHM
jgi:NAD(P)-dependent dehydrogenase (short-subunit alcohol dehydrogenase family)